jgi:hypothetical protein
MSEHIAPGFHDNELEVVASSRLKIAGIKAGALFERMVVASRS